MSSDLGQRLDERVRILIQQWFAIDVIPADLEVACAIVFEAGGTNPRVVSHVAFALDSYRRGERVRAVGHLARALVFLGGATDLDHQAVEIQNEAARAVLHGVTE